MEGKQECNLQSRFHSDVMTLVGDDVMGNGLEPISSAGGLHKKFYTSTGTLSTKKQYDLAVSGGN